jgi:hypothetical protein
MSDGRPTAPASVGRPDGDEPRAPLWFLAEREAFLRRFVLRTLLRPPGFRRGRRPPAFER